MKQIILTIKRTNGETEKLHVEEKFGKMNQEIFDTIKKQTSEAGRGDVLKAEIIEEKNNLRELRRNYNNLYNEGGEGFIPNLKNSPDYKVWTHTTIIK